MTSQIWAVGSGKGGTGKSFISGSMGISMAMNGQKVTMVDADFGGANLHTFLKVKKPRHSLTDFFEDKYPLEKIMIDTPVKNLSLAAGDIRTFYASSIKYTQKLKLFRHIKSIDTGLVIMDLGAGSNLNTIDSFLMADRKILSVIPEITAVENLYQFIRKVLFRKISLILKTYNLSFYVKQTWDSRNEFKSRTIKDFIDHLASLSPRFKDIIQQELHDLKVYIVMNQVKKAADIESGFMIRSILAKHLGIEAAYAGYVGYDDKFWTHINEYNPEERPGNQVSLFNEIQTITSNIQQEKNLKLINFTHD